MILRLNHGFRDLFLGALVLCGVVACDEAHWNAAFPPDGYYDPIWESGMTRGTGAYSGRLVHQFSGAYSISLAFEEAATISEGYAFDELGMSCTFLVDDSLLEVPCGKSLLSYWGDRNGVSVALYSVPEDLPKGVPVEMRVVFGSLAEVEEVVDHHGDVKIVVQNWSEL